MTCSIAVAIDRSQNSRTERILPCSSLADELQRWWISVFRFLEHKMRLPATLKGGKAAPVTSRRSRAQAVLSGPWLRARCRRSGNDAPHRSPRRLRPCSGPTAPPPVRCILLHKGGPSNRKHGAACRTAHRHKRKMARQAKSPKCKSNAIPSANPRSCDSHRSGEGVAVASADVGNSHLSGVWCASDVCCCQKRWRRCAGRHNRDPRGRPGRRRSMGLELRLLSVESCRRHRREFRNCQVRICGRLAGVSTKMHRGRL